MMRRRELMGNVKQPIVWNGSDFTWTLNKCIGQSNNGTAGQESTTNYYKAVIYFVPCEVLVGKSVSITGANVTSVIVTCAFYASDDESSYITGIASNGTKTVPNNARYARFAMSKNADVNGFNLTAI